MAGLAAAQCYGGRGGAGREGKRARAHPGADGVDEYGGEAPEAAYCSSEFLGGRRRLGEEDDVSKGSRLD